MVEMLDHYIGMLVKYLEKTEDPRNPGKKLIDNTYILFHLRQWRDGDGCREK